MGNEIERAVQQAIASGTESFDHSVFDGVLAAAVDDRGLVDYAGMRERPEALADYVKRLEKAPVASLAAPEAKVLLINAYNAFTLSWIVAAREDLASIRDTLDPWSAKRWSLGGHSVSLDEIEHGLLRTQFPDPRIHFAVNCASLGCPPLRARAFVAATLEKDLDEHVRSSLRREGLVRRQDDGLVLNRIFEWFASDFDRAGGVRGFLSKFASGDVIDLLRERGVETPLHFAEYDWRLNRQPAKEHVESAEKKRKDV